MEEGPFVELVLVVPVLEALLVPDEVFVDEEDAEDVGDVVVVIEPDGLAPSPILSPGAAAAAVGWSLSLVERRVGIL